jgi:hypothetical protein
VKRKKTSPDVCVVEYLPPFRSSVMDIPNDVLVSVWHIQPFWARRIFLTELTHTASPRHADLMDNL